MTRCWWRILFRVSERLLDSRFHGNDGLGLDETGLNAETGSEFELTGDTERER